jgi:hypothetical protein
MASLGIPDRFPGGSPHSVVIGMGVNVVISLVGLRRTALTRSGHVRLKLTVSKAPEGRLGQAVGAGHRRSLSRDCGFAVAGRPWHRLERGEERSVYPFLSDDSDRLRPLFPDVLQNRREPRYLLPREVNLRGVR